MDNKKVKGKNYKRILYTPAYLKCDLQLEIDRLKKEQEVKKEQDLQKYKTEWFKNNTPDKRFMIP